MCGGRALSWLFEQYHVRPHISLLSVGHGNQSRHLTFQSDGVTAAYATLITTSFSEGSGVGPGPTTRGFAFSASNQAA